VLEAAKRTDFESYGAGRTDAEIARMSSPIGLDLGARTLPFLPRHSTVLSGLTIGIPSFFLALAPNNERARTGFVRRVLRFAVPAGVIAGSAAFTTYLLARADHATAQVPDTSVTTLTLFLVALWVLAIIARPYTWWRVLLVAAMGGCFALVLVVPWLKRFFQLSLEGWRDPWTAVAVALVAGLLLELVWRYLRHHPDPPSTPLPELVGG